MKYQVSSANSTNHVATKKIKEIERELRELDKKRAILIAQIEKLRHQEAMNQPPKQLGVVLACAVPETAEEKVGLFHKLFCCRKSVYPKLWINKRKNTKGYSPACRNEWAPNLCKKPKVKCVECNNKDFPPLDEGVVQKHLQGVHTIGTYAICEDDSCTFLVCDFDEEGWENDVFVYHDQAESMGIQVHVERSRSGKGAHAWIFFSEQVPAYLARMLGTVILSRATEAKHEMSLKSYDRFFPNQDKLPKGGFGNLIALPLQRDPRSKGNSVFIQRNLMPYKNQWEFLAFVRRLSLNELREVLERYISISTVKNRYIEDVSYESDSKILDSIDDIELRDIEFPPIDVEIGSMIKVPIEGFPSKLITKLKRCATFPNPKFYELQRMRMSTYPHKRFIFSGKRRGDDLLLPRGLLERVQKILKKAGCPIFIKDRRKKKRKIAIEFKGELTTAQKDTVLKMKMNDIGVLVAPPGSGKTVMGCVLIAHRRMPTLILVHRQPLVEQWREQIQTFLGFDKGDIGIVTGSKKKPLGKIDIAMLQSLARSQILDDISNCYGQIIVDECHHVPATSFEAILKQLPARYIVGLTATPYRKDRLEKILFQQCGPIRHEMEYEGIHDFEKRVIVRETGFRMPEDLGGRLPYHVVIDQILNDDNRRGMVVNDVIAAIHNRRFPLVIADRKEYLEELESEIISEYDSNNEDFTITRIDGSFSLKERRNVLKSIKESMLDERPTCLLSTASLIGEGVDLPELDTLVLASPLSFKGRLIQYAGRIHRTIDGKESVLIHDYLDSYSAIMLKMYKNRQRAYKEMGYKVEFIKA